MTYEPTQRICENEEEKEWINEIQDNHSHFPLFLHFELNPKSTKSVFLAPSKDPSKIEGGKS